MAAEVSPEQKHAENALHIAQSTVDSLKVSFASTCSCTEISATEGVRTYNQPQ